MLQITFGEIPACIRQGFTMFRGFHRLGITNVRLTFILSLTGLCSILYLVFYQYVVPKGTVPLGTEYW